MTKDEALRRATAYCARSEHCRHDVLQKLRQWQVDPTYWDDLLDTLCRQSFINEERYARAFARDKHRFSGWGLRRISQELQRKHITSATIQEALSELADEEPIQDKLDDLLQKKLRTLPAELPYRKQYDRLMRYACYKGYDYDEAQRSVEHLLRRRDDLD